MGKNDLKRFFAALVASRTGCWVGYQADLGDHPVPIEAADDTLVGMAEAWRIDADCLAKLRKAQLASLARAVGMFDAEPSGSITPAEFEKLTVARRREAILEYVEGNNVRHVPPEMQFVGRLVIEIGIEQQAKTGRQ